jgi:hypothetical protein
MKGGNERHQRVGLTAARSLAAGALVFALSSPPPPALSRGDDGPHHARQKARESKREKAALAALGRFEAEASRCDPDADCPPARARLASLKSAVASLREGDLRIELATAVFLYERAVSLPPQAAGAEVDCAGERPGVNRMLCVEFGRGGPRPVLSAKARRHSRLAAALARHAEGARDAETLSEVARVRESRDEDARIAAEALALLDRLAALAAGHEVPAAGAGWGASPALRPAAFEREFGVALAELKTRVRWLPQDSLRRDLENARKAYADGLFWWRRLVRSKGLVVDARSLSPDTPPPLGLGDETVGVTVRAMWRQGAKYAGRARTRLVRQEAAVAAEAPKPSASRRGEGR